MSGNNQSWTWKDGVPPGPQTARAGEPWTFRLPLQGSGPPPTIHWIDLPQGIAVRQSPADALTFIFDMPNDQEGIATLRFRRGNNALEDTFLLKIMPARTTAAMPEPPARAQPAASPAARGQVVAPRPEEALQRPHFPQPEPTPTPEIKPASPPAASAVSASNRVNPPSLSDAYEIQVFRGSTPIPQLTCPILPHKSLLVGKLSASRAIFPDIDLRAHFVDSQSENSCSRQQAKIYWSHGQIVLHNVGRSPITLVDGRLLSGGATHDWRPGEEVTLPGGLSLRLALRAI